MKKDIKEEIFNKEGYKDTDGISYKIIDYVNRVSKTYELPETLLSPILPKGLKKTEPTGKD